MFISIHTSVVQLFPLLARVSAHATRAFHSSPCARKSSAWGFAGLGSTGPEYLKASADGAGGRLCTHPYPQGKGEVCATERSSPGAKRIIQKLRFLLGEEAILQFLGLLWENNPPSAPELLRGTREATRTTVTCRLQRTSF